MERPTVFVYGTLKPGEVNYPRYCGGNVLEIRQAFIYGRLYQLDLGYPAITSGGDKVYGYRLTLANNAILASLDLLEGYDPRYAALALPLVSPLENEYNRSLKPIYGLTGELLGLAWVYLMSIKQINHHQGRYLPRGIWHSCLQPQVRALQIMVDSRQW